MCVACLVVLSLVACGAQQAATAESATFAVSSSAFVDGGALPAQFTCDGSSMSPPISWTGAPAGTKSFVVLMDHQPGPGTYKWYWVLYDIDPTITSIAAGGSAGTVGTNEHDAQAYEPPCSKGPGPKTYTITVFALSTKGEMPADAGPVTRDVVLQAVTRSVLAKASISFTYTRS